MSEVNDEELAQSLREARKMPRCFALVMRGTDVLKLAVRKRPFRPAELAELRTEFKGNCCFSGVVRQVEAGELLFESLEEPPEVKLLKFKEHVLEQTRLRITPRFQQVTTLAPVDADDLPVTKDTAEQSSSATQVATQSVADGQAEDSAASQRWDAVHAVWAPRIVAVLQRCSEEQASRWRAAFAAAEEQAEGGNHEKALQILDRLSQAVRQASEDGFGEKPANGGLVASRKFLLTRFRQIKAELKQSLETLRVNIARTAADQNPDELADGMRAWFGDLLEQLQAGIDRSIEAGDGFRAAEAVALELKGGLLKDELLDHLFDNPLMGGEQFVDAIARGLDEIARELHQASAV